MTDDFDKENSPIQPEMTDRCYLEARLRSMASSRSTRPVSLIADCDPDRCFEGRSRTHARWARLWDLDRRSGKAA